MRSKLAIGILATAILTGSFSARAAGQQSTSPAFDDKLICRKIKETGSLVRKKKMCFTQAEWDQIAEVERRGATRMVDELSTRPSGQ